MLFWNDFNALMNEISDEVTVHLQETNSNLLIDALDYSIKAWCERLKASQDINFSSDITDKILSIGRNDNTKILSREIYNKWKPIEITELNSFGRNQTKKSYTTFHVFIDDICRLLNINIGDNPMNFIVLLAFVVVAVLFLAYILNKPKHTSQPDNREKPNTVVTQPISSPAAKPIPQTLILVIPASKSQFLNEFRKRKIVTNEDWENLYDATRYLCLVSLNNLESQLSNIEDKFSKKEEDSDIYLVGIQLSQDDKAG
jgi:hypothetical protein